MELDELKRTWLEFEQRIDTRLSAHESRDTDAWNHRQRDRIRRGLGPLFWGQIALMVFGVGMILMAVAYWSANPGISHRMAVGVLFHVYGVVVIMMAGITLGRLSRIDDSSEPRIPVTTISSRLVAP